MRARRFGIDLPPIVARSRGWMHYAWSDGELLGHDGDALGQQASVRLAADGRFATVVLVNRAAAAPVLDELLSRIAVEQDWPAPGFADSDVHRSGPDVGPIPAAWSGRYQRTQCTLELNANTDPAVLELRYEKPWSDYSDQARIEFTLGALERGDRCLVFDGETAIGRLRFLRADSSSNDRPAWLRLGARLYVAADQFAG